MARCASCVDSNRRGTRIRYSRSLGVLEASKFLLRAELLGTFPFSVYQFYISNLLLQWIITLFPLLASSPPNFPDQSEVPTLSATLIALITPSLWKPLYTSLRTTFTPLLINLHPAICYTILFISSANYSESISAKKYPAYRAYQQRVSMFDPVRTLANKKVKILLTGGKKKLEVLDRLVWGQEMSKKE